MCKLLQRGNFTSPDDLRDQILGITRLLQPHDGQTHQVDLYGAPVNQEPLLLKESKGEHLFNTLIGW